MPDYIKASLSSSRLQVNPGERVEAVISIQNVSNVVDVFTVEVQGLAVQWHSLTSNSMSLFPGDSSTTTLAVNVPRTSSALAQTYAFTVRVSARKAPNEHLDISGELVVAPFYSYNAAIRPQRVAGAVGSYTITLSNNSNTELGFFLEGSDPENLCRFSFNPKDPRVAPGSRLDVPIAVEPGQRPFRGSPRRYALEFRVSPPRETSEPATLRAELEATPRLPRWAIPVALASVGGLVALALLLVVLLPRGPRLDTDFLLNPGQELTYGFNLPSLEPTRLQLVARWEGNVDSLDVSLERPDGSRTSTLKLSRSDPTLRFFVTQEDLRLGASGWKLNLSNASNAGQAEGRLGLHYSRLE